MEATKFGPKQLVNKTPKWALWMFRMTMLLTTVATYIITNDDHITDAVKVQIFNYMKGFDIFIFGLSKMFGVKETDQTDHNER